MATIDLIVLGMVKKEPLSAYDIQKLVEFRKISQWVKISTPSIYKKVIQLEEKGFIKGNTIKEGKMPEKVIYSLTESGDQEFKRLMQEISKTPINIFLDFNAVIVNLNSLSIEEQRACIEGIKTQIKNFRASLEENKSLKENNPDVPEAGMEVLRQQYILVQALDKWVESVKESLA